MTPSVPNFVELFPIAEFPRSTRGLNFVDGYWRVRDRENVLFMTYEEMKKDLTGGAQNRRPAE